ncbi:hypothetical protein C8J56DRAFT_802047, partial [Mycena floridula]
GRMLRLEGGDMMYASSMQSVSAPEDRRDATYVRYDVLVDLNAGKQKAVEKFVLWSLYGQLQNIVTITVPASVVLGLESPEVLVLAGIRNCLTAKKNAIGMPMFTKMSQFDVVDMSCVQCLVGCIPVLGHGEVILDRSGNILRSQYDG